MEHLFWVVSRLMDGLEEDVISEQQNSRPYIISGMTNYCFTRQVKFGTVRKVKDYYLDSLVKEPDLQKRLTKVSQPFMLTIT